MRVTLYTEHTTPSGHNRTKFVRHYKSSEAPITSWMRTRKIKALRKRMGTPERTEYSNLPGGSLLVIYLHTKGGVVVHYW